MLEADAAGARVLTALRLQAGQEAELDGWGDGAGRRMTLAEFTRWANEVLEAARYVPLQAGDPPVVVLPLSQLLARPFAALVLPGCDEKRLQAAPEPQGDWTAAQREAWGLPTRASLETAQRAAWRHALQTPAVDVLWRTGDEGGEPLLASPLVLALKLDGAGQDGADHRTRRIVVVAPTARPQPQGHRLPVQRLSSTAYSDLRHCPYRFFGAAPAGPAGVRRADGRRGQARLWHLAPRGAAALFMKACWPIRCKTCPRGRHAWMPPQRPSPASKGWARRLFALCRRLAPVARRLPALAGGARVDRRAVPPGRTARHPAAGPHGAGGHAQPRGRGGSARRIHGPRHGLQDRERRPSASRPAPKTPSWPSTPRCSATTRCAPLT